MCFRVSVISLAWILEVVFAIAASLPYIERDVWNGLFRLHVPDDTVHVCDHTVLWFVLDDGVFEFSPRRLWSQSAFNATFLLPLTLSTHVRAPE